jgi:hypothetical protein
MNTYIKTIIYKILNYLNLKISKLIELLYLEIKNSPKEEEDKIILTERLPEFLLIDGSLFFDYKICRRITVEICKTSYLEEPDEYVYEGTIYFISEYKKFSSCHVLKSESMESLIFSLKMFLEVENSKYQFKL